MRIVLIVLAAIIVAIIAAAVYFRLVPMPPEVWHVDPAEADLPTTPNYELLVEEDAPVLAMPPDAAARALDRVARAEGAELIGGSVEAGHMTYVVRSRLMGFPDAVSIRLHPEGEQTRVEIFSRSRFGQSDMGVNAARVERWTAKAGAEGGA